MRVFPDAEGYGATISRQCWPLRGQVHALSFAEMRTWESLPLLPLQAPSSDTCMQEKAGSLEVSSGKRERSGWPAQENLAVRAARLMNVTQ